ncbi:MAG: calcium-binding protein, partial [Cyanobacteriota bacterium]|nr:calcium-binding protein [Cyanobacteriota bacterium]
NVLLITPQATQADPSPSEEALGTTSNDVIYGLREDDTVSSFAGDDFINGESGNDLLFSGRGNDIVVGESGDDTVFGDRDGDTVYGGSGDDVLFGNNEDDTLFGDSGDDTLYGGKGNDELIGGTDSDLLLGDDGDDTLTGVTGRGKGYTIIQDFDPSEDTIELIGNDSLYQLVNTEDIDTSVDLPSGTAIIFVDSEDSQLVAVVEGNLSLDLNANYFTFF